MLKIYNSYYMYQINRGEWSRFGYTGWFCKEESEVIDLKTILKDATFEQAFEHFEKNQTTTYFLPEHLFCTVRIYICVKSGSLNL